MQKVMANNKLKEKKQQLQNLQKSSTQSANNAEESSDAVGEPNEDSFVVTPDYIQQSKNNLINASL